MKDMMTYKGYTGSAHYDDDDRIFYGKLEFIRDLVSYEGADVDSLRSAFEEAVDDYLDLCRQEGRQPEQPFKGSFNVRMGSELHRRAALCAKEKGANLNQVVKEALERYLAGVASPALGASRSYRELMADIRARQQVRGHKPPTREEVDAALHSERESWEQ